MKQQVEASRTNRMRNTLDLLSKQNTSGSASKPEGAFDELKFAVGKLGEMIKPPEGKTRQQVWDEYMKDGGKSEAIKEVNRFANRTMDSALPMRQVRP